jgi:hypothetical protein
MITAYSLKFEVAENKDESNNSKSKWCLSVFVTLVFGLLHSVFMLSA